MAEEKAPPKVTFDEAAVKKKFQTIEANVNKVAGKKGHNPFFWIATDVQPLVDKYMKGERSDTLFKAIMALPDVPKSPEIQVEPTEAERRQEHQRKVAEEQAKGFGLFTSSK